MITIKIFATHEFHPSPASSGTLVTVTESLTNAQASIQREATRFEALFVANKICSLYGYMVSGEEILTAYRLKN